MKPAPWNTISRGKSLEVIDYHRYNGDNKNNQDSVKPCNADSE